MFNDGEWYRWIADHMLGIFAAFVALVMWLIRVMFAAQREEIKEIKMSISKQRQDFENHKLFASENFVKHWQIDDIKESQQRMEERMDEIYKLLTRRGH